MEDIDSMLRLDPMERVHFDREENLYSIIKTVEYLEFAYMSGKVQGAEYDTQFRSLHHQYQLCLQQITDFAGLDAFMDRYNINHCQSAKTLLKNGASNYRGEETDRNLAQRVFEITTKFVQPMDLLALDIRSIDEILPPVRDVQQALQNYPNLPADYKGLQQVNTWVDRMSQMEASAELEEKDAR